jgi:Na+/H+ antiporter NhaA
MTTRTRQVLIHTLGALAGGCAASVVAAWVDLALVGRRTPHSREALFILDLIGGFVLAGTIACVLGACYAIVRARLLRRSATTVILTILGAGALNGVGFVAGLARAEAPGGVSLPLTGLLVLGVITLYFVTTASEDSLVGSARGAPLR